MEWFFEGVETFYNFIFGLLPATMRILAFSILLATFGKILGRKKGWKWGILKALHLMFYIFWGMWKFGVISAYSLGEQVFQSVGLLLMLLAIIITYMGRNLSFFGYRVINYYTLWFFYWIALVILLPFDYHEGAIGFSFFYLALCVILVRISTHEPVKDL